MLALSRASSRTAPDWPNTLITDSRFTTAATARATTSRRATRSRPNSDTSRRRRAAHHLHGGSAAIGGESLSRVGRAARGLGRRALLLIGHERNRPLEPLPAGIAAFEYAPYGEVLPRASAVVHQGGVGTTGQALRAGRPALVVPFSHDQFDNGARVARLGCGRMLARGRYNAASATRELRAILDDEI